MLQSCSSTVAAAAAVIYLCFVLALFSTADAQSRSFPYERRTLKLAANRYEDIPTDNAVLRPEPIIPPPPPQDPNVIVVPRLGLVRGQIDYKTIRNRGVNAFRNLKYGVVRNGLGRFQKATPVNYDLSDDVILATDIAQNCPQFPDLQTINASEHRGEVVDDCLTLNVYAPNKPGLYPVIVFVHGEMLFDGTAEEGQPDYFLEHDVVLVTVNYRLAPFGFLTTLTDEMPGNVALSDIHLALEWIQQYIQPFGGDPDQVTLLGQAGGATLVHALSLSNRTQGLFHKLILQSGTALNPYFLDEDPLNTARSFARLARCPLVGGSRALQSLNECFDRLSTTDLLSLMERFWDMNEPRGLRFAGAFKLVVGDRLGYLEEHPAALVTRDVHYPMLAGVTKDAGAFIMSRAMFTQLQQLRSANISDYINVALRHVAQPRHYAIWQRWALEHIFDDVDVRNPSLNRLAQGLLELVNLILYRGPIIDSIRYSARKSPTFLYCFDYRGEFHRFGHLSNPLPFATDATLSDDSIYLFPYPVEVSKLNHEDRTLSRAVVQMWVNFVLSNMPNPNPGIWPNVTTEYGPFVRITNSKTNAIELDFHYGEGIPVPNLYPEYRPAPNSTATTTTRRPPYRYPSYPQQQQQQHQQQQQDERPSYYRQNPRRPYETVLNNGEISLQRPPQPLEYRQPYNGQYPSNG